MPTINYLDKSGLSHFWDKIDAKKQNKLTAGAGISITGDTISATGGGTADAVDWGHITGSMSNQIDLTTALAAKADSADLATVATSGSYNDLSDKPDIMTGLTEMSYGESNAWTKFLTAYRAKQIVYCKASSNANPATGSQTRKAFMAYVDNVDNPTNVEFQYVRSVGSKTASQPVDQVFVYKLTSANGGTWTVQTRDMAPKLAKGTNTTVTYSNGTYKISATQPTVNDATLTIQKNGTTVKTFTANASSNVTANITVPTTVAELSDSSDYATTTDLAAKQNLLSPGNHISIASNVISATGYVHSENPQASAAASSTITGSMIANGTITADKLATGATVKLTMSTSDIGEGAPLAANTLYGVYR